MKIVIIGRGNAGCISATHFAHYRNFIDTKVEIELIYDSSIPPVPTGQGTTLQQLRQVLCMKILVKKIKIYFTISL